MKQSPYHNASVPHHQRVPGTDFVVDAFLYLQCKGKVEGDCLRECRAAVDTLVFNPLPLGPL